VDRNATERMFCRLKDFRRIANVALDKIAPGRGTDVTGLRRIVIAYVIVFASSDLAED
jgi:hypothetical protein